MKKQNKGLLRDDNETINQPVSVGGSAMTGGKGINAPNAGADLSNKEQPAHREPPVHHKPGGGMNQNGIVIHPMIVF